MNRQYLFNLMTILKQIHALSIIVLLIMLYFGYCMGNSSTTLADAERLFNTTILATGHKYRPTFNQSQPTVVYLTLMMLSLADVDEVHQSVSWNILLTLRWLDEIRQWDPNDYGGLASVHPDPQDTWRPRIFLSNSISQRDMFKDDYAPLTIYNTGETEWLPGGIMYTSCSMKMTHFPFDTQTCALSFTVGESTDTIQLLPDSFNINFSHYDQSGEWIIESSKVIPSLVNGKSNIKYSFQLSRVPFFTLLSLVIPVNIISSLSSLVFIMPVGSGERVSFSITVLLSLTVYSGEITKDLPTSSESLPLLIMYLTSFLLHSGLAIVANLIVLITHYHHTKSMKDVKKSDVEMKSHTNSHGSGKVPVRKMYNRTKMYDRNRSVDEEMSECDLINDYDFTAKNSENVCMCNLGKRQISNKIQMDSTHSETTSSTRTRKKCLFTINEEAHTRFGSFLENPSKDIILNDDCDKRNNSVCVKLSPFCIFHYMSRVNVTLFILFFSVWLVLTVVFMSLIAFGNL